MCSSCHKVFKYNVGHFQKMPQQVRVSLHHDFRKDLKWFLKFMPSTNGIFMLKQQSPPACVIVADSCISAGGAVSPIVK
jgi:hypothetical protein